MFYECWCRFNAMHKENDRKPVKEVWTRVKNTRGTNGKSGLHDI